jgi:nucleotide-binding universal stress UspA family protein
MTILAGTDFSSCSRTAIRVAAALARRQAAPLVLAHAFEPPPVDAWATPWAGAWEKQLLETDEQLLAEEAESLRREGLAVETRLEVGSPAGVVLAVAREVDAQLVVVGTHGRTGAARLFLGSVAEQVVRSTDRPVLVTPAELADAARWEGGERLRLTVASDGTGAADPAFFWLSTSGQALAGEVSVVRVYWPPHEAARYGLDEPWQGRAGHPELVRLVERDVRHAAAALDGAREPQISLRIASADSARDVGDEALRRHADALVMVVPRHPRRWLAPLTPRAVLAAAPLPVFCIPETIQPAGRNIPRFGSVLLASDLSDASSAAILPAYGLLAGGGRVELCHVHERRPGASGAELGARPAAALSGDERARIEARLRAQIPAEAAAHGIATHVSVAEGASAAEAILALAERLNVEVIALGSHGRGTLGRALLGSVAVEVARRSPRPVLITGAHARAGAAS